MVWFVKALFQYLNTWNWIYRCLKSLWKESRLVDLPTAVSYTFDLILVKFTEPNRNREVLPCSFWIISLKRVKERVVQENQTSYATSCNYFFWMRYCYWVSALGRRGVILYTICKLKILFHQCIKAKKLWFLM